jgi:hypothetical protein
VSNKLYNPPQHQPPPPPRQQQSEKLAMLKSAVINPPKPLLATVATTAAAAKLGQEKPLIQTNLETYKKLMVQPLRDEKSNQVRMEFLQQQALISKLQKHELKEYLKNKEMLNQHLQQQQQPSPPQQSQLRSQPQPQQQQQPKIMTKELIAARNGQSSNNGSIKKSPQVNSNINNNSTMPMGNDQTSAAVNKNDRLINCILEMKAPQQPPPPPPQQPIIDNQRVKSVDRKTPTPTQLQPPNSQPQPRQVSNVSFTNLNTTAPYQQMSNRSSNNAPLPLRTKQVIFR